MLILIALVNPEEVLTAVHRTAAMRHLQDYAKYWINQEIGRWTRRFANCIAGVTGMRRGWVPDQYRAYMS